MEYRLLDIIFNDLASAKRALPIIHRVMPVCETKGTALSVELEHDDEGELEREINDALIDALFHYPYRFEYRKY